MAEVMESLPHLTLTGTVTTEQYKYAGGTPRVTFRLPPRDSRPQHAAHLATQIQQAQADADVQTSPEEAEKRRGITLEFQSEPNFGLLLDSLENRQQGIELANVRQAGNVVCGTAFVPEGRVGYFLRRIDKYANEETKRGEPKNRKLIESISQIRLAAVEAFWTDRPDLFPQTNEAIWWEVWIRTGPTQPDQDTALAEFVVAAADAGVQLGQQTVRFPERLVLLARCTQAQWASSINLLNWLAELRRAKEVPTQYVQLPPKEQADLIEIARSRIQPPPADAPVVCLLDTGVNRGHRLLELALDEAHVMACDPNWSAADQDGHGTEMAGIALYGCLTSLLSGKGPVQLRHRLESIKILPPHGQNDPEHYGALTTEGVARAEVESPQRKRAVCLTVTADDRDGGLPTSWSGAIDQICAGALDEQRRLVFVSAGNIRSGPPAAYPRENHELHGIQDPAQSWNTITVAAYTERVHITSPDWQGWQPVAQHGSLSPTSTTSLPWTWDDAPLKPDIVMEGGNCATPLSGGQPDFVDDLSLLTTCVHPTGRMLTTTGETSAAAAQGAQLAAIIHSHYPQFWPETVRALLIHSAQWTTRMLEEFPYELRQRRMRVYGYGVPDLDRALWSASNATTLVIQDQLQPFEREGSAPPRTRDMHLHALPWPTEVLENLGAEKVSMRVTLSYFIEPSPGRRGWTRRHRYQSHGLRFDVRRPSESLDEFRQRLTRTAWEDPDVRPETTSESHDWELGRNLRTRGSIHSDQWTGIAADLAASGFIGVYPVTGWWRERPHLERWDRLARYALVVTISTPRVDVDLYTAIQNQVAISQAIEII